MSISLKKDKRKKRVLDNVEILDPRKNMPTPGLRKISAKIFGERALDCKNEMLAVSSGKIVGIFVFSLSPKKKVMMSEGTIVDQRFQKKGIASRLWKAAISKHKPEIVSVNIVSDAGRKFIEKMKKNYPRIEWDVW